MFLPTRKHSVMQKNFTEIAIDWFNELPGYISKKFPNKWTLKRTIKNFFWQEYLKDPKVIAVTGNLRSFKFRNF